MAESTDSSGTPGEPDTCRACRGSGTVISGLGGEPSELKCPWCEGTGTRIPDHDAQARWAEGGKPSDDA